MNKIIDSVSKLYDEVAVYWSHTRKYLWPDILPYIKKISKGDRVLDIGCGNGRLLTKLPEGVDYVGVDISKGLIREAKKLHPNRKFLYGDITKNEIWNKLPKADAIFCVAVLHHLPWRRNHKFVMSKMYEKLEKNGFVYLTVQNFWGKKFGKHHFSLTSMMVKKVNFNWLYMPFGEDRKLRFMYAFRKRYLVNLAKNAGFNVEEVFYSDKKNKDLSLRDGYNLVLVLKKCA